MATPTPFKEKLNSRKLWLAVGCIILATGMRIGDLIEAENWVTVIITIGGAYMVTQAYVDAELSSKNKRS